MWKQPDRPILPACVTVHVTSSKLELIPRLCVLRTTLYSFVFSAEKESVEKSDLPCFVRMLVSLSEDTLQVDMRVIWKDPYVNQKAEEGEEPGVLGKRRFTTSHKSQSKLYSLRKCPKTNSTTRYSYQYLVVEALCVRLNINLLNTCSFKQ